MNVRARGRAPRERKPLDERESRDGERGGAVGAKSVRWDGAEGG